MRARILAVGLVVVPLLLAGCTATPAPVRTVTVTARPTVVAPKSGDAGPWDLHAVCAAESEIETIVTWRTQQVEANRLTATQSAAVLQSIAVQNLELDAAGLPASVQKDISVLVAASGTLEHPMIDLHASAVERARNDIAQTCQASGLTIGVIAQGG